MYSTSVLNLAPWYSRIDIKSEKQTGITNFHRNDSRQTFHAFVAGGDMLGTLGLVISSA